MEKIQVVVIVELQFWAFNLLQRILTPFACKEIECRQAAGKLARKNSWVVKFWFKEGWILHNCCSCPRHIELKVFHHLCDRWLLCSSNDSVKLENLPVIKS